MRLLLFFVLYLTLWVTGLDAFFPFYPDSRCAEDSLCSSGRRRDTEAQRGEHGSSIAGKTFKLTQRTKVSSRSDASSTLTRARSKYARNGLEVGKGSLRNRADSVYDVLLAGEPAIPRAEGVSQDGTDFSYFIEVEIGSTKKPIYMLIDTGAGTSWIMSSTCKSSPCAIHQTFGPPDSDTLAVEDSRFEIHYGSGSVSGVVANDTFHIAGFEMKFQFGLADIASDDFNYFPFDGILGLGLGKGSTENFVEELIEEEVLEKNLFGVYLNRASDGDTGGEISFGSINPDKYMGDITYMQLDNKGRDWAISMGDFYYGEENAGVTKKLAYIDTGTSYAFGPKSEVAKIYAMIDGAVSSDGITFTVPCDANEEVAVSFSGRRFVISAKDWRSGPDENGVCTGSFYGIEVVSGAWLLGDVFLKNVYAVFDADNKRIGFATRPEIVSTSTTSSSSSTSTSHPGTKTQEVTGNDSATPVIGVDSALSSVEPTAASGQQLGSNSVYTIAYVVAIIAAVS